MLVSAMNVFLVFAKICYICILTSVVNAYVLFAANLEDFRNIAKKFIPSKIADQLAELAANPSMKLREDRSQAYEDTVPDTRVNKEKDLPNYNGPKPKQTRFSVQGQEAVNIDEIVEKVKEKLEKDFHNKYVANLTALQQMINKNVNKKQGYDENIDYSQDYTPKDLSQPKIGAKTGKLYKNKPSQVQEEANTPDNTDDTKTFSKIKIGQVKDSYEEYVIPERDDSSNPVNIKNNGPYQNTNDRERDYDSVSRPVKQKYKGQQNTNREDRDYSAPDQNTNKNERDNESGHKSKFKQKRIKHIVYDIGVPNIKSNQETKPFDHVKAQTENLFYEDLVTERSKRLFKNTMIPTKRVFRFSSPNYYAQLPTVVDKYDFNEPLPERDRERENLKHIPNPPASINGRPALQI